MNNSNIMVVYKKASESVPVGMSRLVFRAIVVVAVIVMAVVINSINCCTRGLCPFQLYCNKYGCINDIEWAELERSGDLVYRLDQLSQFPNLPVSFLKWIDKHGFELVPKPKPHHPANRLDNGSSLGLPDNPPLVTEPEPKINAPDWVLFYLNAVDKTGYKLVPKRKPYQPARTKPRHPGRIISSF